MLKPAGQKTALIAFFIGSFGFVMGTVWISSRASIGALIHFQATGGQVQPLVELYRLRYETLLTVIRLTTLILSGLIVYGALTGKSHYPKLMALFNPAVLLLLNFGVYLLLPSVGKFLMPIALNIGFGVFFILSLMQVRKIIF